MNSSQQKAITFGLFGVAALILIFAIIRFIQYFDYQGKLNQAGAFGGPDAVAMAREMAQMTGQSVSIVLPVILLLVAAGAALIAFRRLGKKTV